MSGNIFGCHTSGERCYWPLAGGARVLLHGLQPTRQPPAAPCSPPQHGMTWPQMAVVQPLRKPDGNRSRQGCQEFPRCAVRETIFRPRHSQPPLLDS